MTSSLTAKKEEIRKRIGGATYVWQKLKSFWRDGLLSRREKILIYDALVGSKVLYGLHTLPLKDANLRKLDAFHLRGLRRILGIPTTYIDRAATNKRVLEAAENEISKKGRRKGGQPCKKIKLMSEVITDRSRELLGDIMRLDTNELKRQVTFQGETPHPNLPSESRVGRPKTHWTINTMGRVWNEMRIHIRSANTTGIQFDYRNDEHLTLLLEAARQNEF